MTTLYNNVSLLDKFQEYIKENSNDSNFSNLFEILMEDFKKSIQIKRVPSWASMMSSSYSSDDNNSQLGSPSNLNNSFTSDKIDLSDDENPMDDLFSKMSENNTEISPNLNFNTNDLEIDKLPKEQLLESIQNDSLANDLSIKNENIKEPESIVNKKKDFGSSNSDSNYIVHTGINKENLFRHVKEIHSYLKESSLKTKNWRESTCENILNDEACENDINCKFSHNFLLCKKNHKNSINSTHCRTCNLKLPDECQDMFRNSFCCKPFGSQEFASDKCTNTHGWKCYECKSNNKHNTELCLFCAGPRVNIGCY